MLDQIDKMHVSEIEPLYWILEDALESNNKKRAEGIFNLLAMTAKHRKQLIADGLHEAQRERLQKIAFELFEGESTVTRKSVEIKMARSSKPLPFQKEKDLEEWLSNHEEVLSSSLGERIWLVGRQVKTDFDYACDLVVEGDQYFYPIELKIGQTNHSVVSQIQKYCFYFYRKLRYDRYKPIQGVVIGNGFDTYSINELRKSGIRIFDLFPADRHTVELREVS